MVVLMTVVVVMLIFVVVSDCYVFSLLYDGTRVFVDFCGSLCEVFG